MHQHDFGPFEQVRRCKTCGEEQSGAAQPAPALTPEEAKAVDRQITDAAWAYPLDGILLEKAALKLRRLAGGGE